MYNNRSLVVGIVGILILAGWQTPSYAQGAVPALADKILGQPCNLHHDLVPVSDVDPTPVKPPTLVSFLAQKFVSGEKFIIDPKIKNRILTSGLPCQETVSSSGPAETALENRQRGFDFYSWLTFIALNSPADDKENKAGIEDSRPNTKTKWEDRHNFMHLLDVMVQDPEKNAPEWGKRKIPEECLSKYKGEDIKDMMVIEMIEETFNEPFKTGALIDQQGNYALFDILMNQKMFKYILDNKLYSKKAQLENAALKVDFPAGINPDASKGIVGDPGAIMIKVSWKVIESERDKQRFHTVDALVLMPRHEGKSESPPCLRKALGLVGFHVGHKTTSRLQWIWTSFEHVDNVPEDKEIASGNLKPPYNFYDPKCSVEKCPVNQTPPRPWDPAYPNGLKFHDSTFKSQITRVIPLTDDTRDINGRFQNILGDTVWKNYMLLSTQWPSGFPCAKQTVEAPRPVQPSPDTDFEKQPDMTCAPAPPYLANSTLETYSQGKIPLASSSCMACHGNAVSHQRRAADVKPGDFYNQSDFTFMLEKAR